MSNYISTFAIPWADKVCKEFDKQTGVRLLFEPPKPGDRQNTTVINFYTRGYKFEREYLFSNEFLEDGGSIGYVSHALLEVYQNKSS